MFYLISILKLHFSRAFLAAVAIAALTLIAQPAHAAGETYAWADDTNQSVTVAGGSGQVSGTLKKTAATSAATFTGDVSYTCSGAAKTSKVSLDVSNADFKKIYPTLANLTVPSEASCAAFDLAIAVAKADGTTTADQQAAAASCDQGSMSWLMCPFIDNATGAITKLANGVLIPLLRVKAINQQSTPELYDIWLKMVNLAEIMFLLVFLVIIFATITQQDIGYFDQYTIKKVLPRLVVAAILVQASFLLVGFMVDIGNVMGAGIEDLLRAATGPQSDASFAHVLTNLVGIGLAGALALGAVLGAASWVAIAPLLASMAISLLVVFLVLGLRFLLIAILIVVSPLAMVAWVLPNTRHWAKDWMELLFRLVLMYPIIVGVISLAGLVNSILPAGSSTADSVGAGMAGNLIKPIVVIAAFLIIPVTFKLAGKGLTRAYDLMNGHAQRGKGALKSSDFWQRGVDERKKRKNQHMENFMNSKPITSLSSGNKLKRGVAGAAMVGFGGGMLAGGPTSKRALDKRNAQLVKSDGKLLDDLTEAQSPKNMQDVLAAYAEPDAAKRRGRIDDLNRTVPNLAQIGSNQTGRRAILSRLSDKGFLTDNDVNNVLKAGRLSNPTSVSRDPASEYAALMSEVGKSRSSNPFSTMRMTEAKDKYTPKDAAGQPMKVIDSSGNEVELVMKRERGDLDWTSIDKQLRKTTANTLGDKFSTDNWGVILKGQEPDATELEKRVSRESAERVAASLPQRSITGAFDVTGRNMAPVEHRLKMARAFASQRAAITATQVGRDKYEALTADFHRDSDITHELAREAGVPATLLDNLSTTTKAWVAYELMQGRKYNPATSTLKLNSDASNWVTKQEAARLKNIGRNTTPPPTS